MWPVGEKPRVLLHAKRRWIVLLLAVIFVMHVLNPNRVWVALLFGLGGALGLGHLWTWQMASRVTAIREQRYGWVHVGDLLEERFELSNGSFLPIPWVEIVDHSNLPGYSASSVRSAESGQTIRWRSEGVCRQRGLFTLGPWQLRLGDPFGFFDITLEYAQTRSILVYPPVVHLPSILLPKGAATGSGRTSRRALDVTTNAAGIRGYAPGDSLRWVHWPSTARRGALMVKTFDLEPAGDLWIVLDLDAAVQAGEEEESTEEYGVILASSLADRTLRQNRAVGLVAYGISDRGNARAPEPTPTIVMPQRGTAHQWRILQELARVRAVGNWPLGRVLAEMDPNLGRGMTLAVITPSCDPDWLSSLLPPMRRGVAPTVVLLDPVSFGGTGNVDGMRALLADLGIPSHSVAKGMPFRPTVEHKRIGRPEYRVLPATGRVVAVEP